MSILEYNTLKLDIKWFVYSFKWYLGILKLVQHIFVWHVEIYIQYNRLVYEINKDTKFGQNPLKDVDSRVFTRMLHGKTITQWPWPWKSIGFQTLLRTKYVPSLVKIPQELHYCSYVWANKLYFYFGLSGFVNEIYYPLANEVAKGYSNASVRPSVTSLWTLLCDKNLTRWHWPLTWKINRDSDSPKD
jgi:hypothetical protein